MSPPNPNKQNFFNYTTTKKKRILAHKNFSFFFLFLFNCIIKVKPFFSFSFSLCMIFFFLSLCLISLFLSLLSFFLFLFFTTRSTFFFLLNQSWSQVFHQLQYHNVPFFSIHSTCSSNVTLILFFFFHI